MRKKLSKIGLLFYGTIFILAFFSSLRIVAIYYYHLQMANGNQTLAMTLMDKASVVNLPMYVSGWLHGWVIGIMILIVLNK